MISLSLALQLLGSGPGGSQRVLIEYRNLSSRFVALLQHEKRRFRIEKERFEYKVHAIDEEVEKRKEKIKIQKEKMLRLQKEVNNQAQKRPERAGPLRHSRSSSYLLGKFVAVANRDPKPKASGFGSETDRNREKKSRDSRRTLNTSRSSSRKNSVLHKPKRFKNRSLSRGKNILENKLEKSENKNQAKGFKLFGWFGK